MPLLDLPLKEVHVWQVGLDVETARLSELATLLSEEEQRCAARFHFDRDCNRWIAAHGLLRVVLGKYVATHPGALRFKTGPYGKPTLIDEGICFNFSHSDNQALIAVAQKWEIGVDIERLRSDFLPNELAVHVFSAQEQAYLKSFPPHLTHHAFLTIWTGKEAYTKARGSGLSYPLTHLTLRVDPGAPTLWAEDIRGSDIDLPLFLCRLPVPENFVAALAVEGSPEIIRLFAL